MITSEELTHPAVRTLLTAVQDREQGMAKSAVAGDFVCNATGLVTSAARPDMGDLGRFLSARPLLAVTGQSEDGLTLTGLANWRGHAVGSRWVFSAHGGRLGQLRITRAELPDADLKEAQAALDELATGAGVGTFRTVRDSDGRTHPKGRARRLPVGGHHYLHSWTAGPGGISWISTGEKLPDPDVYRAHRDPATGEHTAESAQSKVTSHLDVTLGWDDTYQKATVTFQATPYYWDAVTWLAEDLPLTDEAKPELTGTLTLTGPDHTVVSTEEITVKAAKAPHLLTFTREFSLADAPVGDYTLTLTDPVKTRGFRSRKDGIPTNRTDVHMKDHTITFTVGA
ncbi:hypothetical protein ACFC60_26215 [Kitasatospora purpeofusca]|uniref:hypothetical protein n=1 Tax=Kitasatospora purpeofusca TaxID=67352 RepID=UPI0035DD6257